MVKQGSVCGNKIRWPDGVAYCIWHPFAEYEDAGICWDFAEEQIDDVITLLQKLKATEAEERHEDDTVPA